MAAEMLLVSIQHGKKVQQNLLWTEAEWKRVVTVCGEK